jgi:hypothetical protein
MELWGRIEEQNLEGTTMTQPAKQEEEDVGTLIRSSRWLWLTCCSSSSNQNSHHDPFLPPFSDKSGTSTYPRAWIWPAAKFSGSARQTPLFQEAPGPPHPSRDIKILGVTPLGPGMPFIDSDTCTRGGYLFLPSMDGWRDAWMDESHDEKSFTKNDHNVLYI